MNSKNPPFQIRCERCNEILKPETAKSLEYSNTDGNYYVEVPEGHESLGFYYFGAKCATTQLKETKTFLDAQ